jgi:hypothetical protein
VLKARGRPGDEAQAQAYLATALSTAHEIGMTALEPVARATETSASTTSVPAAVVTNVFRRDGEFWTITFAGTTFPLRDTKGLAYLARLLASPDREIHAIDLVRGAPPDGAGLAAADADRAAASELGSDPFAGIGDILDPAARDEYRGRLNDIDEDLAEAEQWNDPERAARLKIERDFLVRELAGATGLSGRSRTAASASERARVSATRAIWSAVDRIAAHGPELGRHLSISIHTGTYCSYTPDPALNIVWQL